MPHVLLHLTSLRLLEGEPYLHPVGHELLKRRRGMVALGAALAELPNLAPARGRQWKTGLAKENERAPWSARMHHEKPMALAIALLAPQHTAQPLGPLVRAALGLGFITHAALDTVLHPLVHKLVAAEKDEHPFHAHLRIEKYQAALLHPKLAHMPLADDDDAWGMLEFRGYPQTQRAVEHINAALHSVYGSLPAADDWTAWLDGAHGYADHVRHHLDQGEGGGADLAMAQQKWVDAPHLADAFTRAQARAASWANRVCAAFQDGAPGAAELATLAVQFPECDLDSAKDPFADHPTGGELHDQRDRADHWRLNYAPRRKTAARPPPPPPPSMPPPTREDAPPQGLPVVADAADGQEMNKDGDDAGGMRPPGRTPR